MPRVPVMPQAILLMDVVVLALLASPSAAARNLPEFTQLVEQQSASVVNISKSQRRAVSSSGLNNGTQ
jgi:hypothetical protein